MTSIYTCCDVMKSISSFMFGSQVIKFLPTCIHPGISIRLTCNLRGSSPATTSIISCSNSFPVHWFTSHSGINTSSCCFQVQLRSYQYSNKFSAHQVLQPLHILEMASTSFSYSKLTLPDTWNNDTLDTEDAPLITPDHRSLKSKVAKAGVSVKKRTVALMKFLDGPAEV